MHSFSIFEASIEEHRDALDSGLVSSVELVVRYLIRIATYDIRGGLHAFTLINDRVFEEAQASDERRRSGLPNRPLEGIPYTLKDSYKYAGLTVTNGSPALEGLMSNEDSHIASTLRNAGAVLIGKTNMPPMAASGMHRGLYGRAENPYNPDYLTAAFSSGSSNGAGTATAASFAAFGFGSETVSSGRSPASNNALVAYTPSKGILSCRGLWPLYVTCDVVVPYTRSLKDMLEVLDVITEPDAVTPGDFWRHQPFVELPLIQKPDYMALLGKPSLANKRIAVPKRYIGGSDSHPNAKACVVSPEVVEIWKQARSDLEELGATVVETDFPMVSNYEDDSVSKEANNVTGAPAGWNTSERGMLVAKAWDDFLINNMDDKITDLTKVNPELLFPRVKGYVPDIFIEHKNIINYAGLPAMAKEHKDISLYEVPGLGQAVKALETQRKKDFDQWLDENGFDFVVFPSAADVGKADLESNEESAEHALRNGVKYSNGNRAIRHLGVPTVSIPMGTMKSKKMPLNLTLAGKAYSDEELLQYAYVYEQKTLLRRSPPLTPELATDKITISSRQGSVANPQQPPLLDAVAEQSMVEERTLIKVSGTLMNSPGVTSIRLYLDGEPLQPVQVQDGPWENAGTYNCHGKTRLSYLLEPIENSPIMVLVVASHQDRDVAAKLLWI